MLTAVHILLADRHLLNNWPIEAEKVIDNNDVTMVNINGNNFLKKGEIK